MAKDRLEALQRQIAQLKNNIYTYDRETLNIVNETERVKAEAQTIRKNITLVKKQIGNMQEEVKVIDQANSILGNEIMVKENKALALENMLQEFQLGYQHVNLRESNMIRDGYDEEEEINRIISYKAESAKELELLGQDEDN